MPFNKGMRNLNQIFEVLAIYLQLVPSELLRHSAEELARAARRHETIEVEVLWSREWSR
jgi:hypothetical protein